MEGKYLDSLEMGKDVGPIFGIDIIDNILYFSGYGNKYIGKYDLKENKVIKILKRSKKAKKAPEHYDIFKNGIVKGDYESGKIFYGYAGYPYRIENMIKI